jgi:hypothetical protein
VGEDGDSAMVLLLGANYCCDRYTAETMQGSGLSVGLQWVSLMVLYEGSWKFEE